MELVLTLNDEKRSEMNQNEGKGNKMKKIENNCSENHLRMVQRCSFTVLSEAKRR